MIKKNIFSITVAIIILYLSLTSSSTFDKVPLINIPHIDKIVHFLMYSGFMSVIILEHRKLLIFPRQIFLTALIPLGYGILMEILQAALATSRTGSVFDALFNTAGIVSVVLFWIYIKPFLFKRSD